MYDRDHIEAFRKRTDALLSQISELKRKSSGHRLEQVEILSNQINSFDAFMNAAWRSGIKISPGNEAKSLKGADHLLRIYEEQIDQLKSG